MKKSGWLLLIALSVVACKKEVQESLPADLNLKGVFVSNEGAYGANNASISHISENGDVVNDMFEEYNGQGLGDVLQSVGVIGENMYAVVNNSQKVEVMNMKTFKRVATITGCDYPRHIIGVGNNKAYLSNGSFTGEVLVMDLATHQIIKRISVGMGPERMLLKDGFVYVANSGGWSVDNSLSVIDVQNDVLVETIRVGDVPVDLVEDNAGNVVVMSSGKQIWDDSWSSIIEEGLPQLFVVNPTSRLVTDSIVVGQMGEHPVHIEISPAGDVLYSLNGTVRAYQTGDYHAEPSIVYASEASAMQVNPLSGQIWLTGIPDYSQPGKAMVLSEDGVLQGSFTLGIAPNGFCFYEE